MAGPATVGAVKDSTRNPAIIGPVALMSPVSSEVIAPTREG